MGFKGGFASFVDGYMRSSDAATNRARLEAADKRTEDMFQLQMKESQRKDRESEEAERIRKANAAVPTTREMEMPGVGVAPENFDGTVEAPLPTKKTVQVANDELFRAYAKNFAANGRVEEAAKYQAAADKMGFERAGRELNQLRAASAGMSPFDAATKAAEIFSNDPMPGAIRNVTKSGDTGVAFEIYNKDTGKAHAMKFDRAEDVFDGLSSYYAPDSYAKIVEAREAAKTKSTVLSPGQQNWVGGKLMQENTRETLTELKARGGVGGTDKPFKMDEDDKIRLRDSNSRVADAEKALVGAMKDITPGEDPSKYPAVIQAQSMLKAAKVGQFKTNVQLGQIAPERLAAEILGAAKNPADVMKSLNEIGSTVGTDFTDQVGALISQSDAWKAWTAKKEAAAPAPAAKTVMSPQALAQKSQVPATDADAMKSMRNMTPINLERIAAEKGNPRARIAQAVLDEMHAMRKQGQYERVYGDDQFNPEHYK